MTHQEQIELHTANIAENERQIAELKEILKSKPGHYGAKRMLKELDEENKFAKLRLAELRAEL